MQLYDQDLPKVKENLKFIFKRPSKVTKEKDGSG
jgi:hypothetical protein